MDLPTRHNANCGVAARYLNPNYRPDRQYNTVMGSVKQTHAGLGILRLEAYTPWRT